MSKSYRDAKRTFAELTDVLGQVDVEDQGEIVQAAKRIALENAIARHAGLYAQLQTALQQAAERNEICVVRRVHPEDFNDVAWFVVESLNTDDNTATVLVEKRRTMSDEKIPNFIDGFRIRADWSLEGLTMVFRGSGPAFWVENDHWVQWNYSPFEAEKHQEALLKGMLFHLNGKLCVVRKTHSIGSHMVQRELISQTVPLTALLSKNSTILRLEKL